MGPDETCDEMSGEARGTKVRAGVRAACASGRRRRRARSRSTPALDRHQSKAARRSSSRETASSRECTSGTGGSLRCRVSPAGLAGRTSRRLGCDQARPWWVAPRRMRGSHSRPAARSSWRTAPDASELLPGRSAGGGGATAAGPGGTLLQTRPRTSTNQQTVEKPDRPNIS